jgi:hypothetical protein
MLITRATEPALLDLIRSAWWSIRLGSDQRNVPSFDQWAKSIGFVVEYDITTEDWSLEIDDEQCTMLLLKIGRPP